MVAVEPLEVHDDVIVRVLVIDLRPGPEGMERSIYARLTLGFQSQ